ncbi:MAG: hypothetical protein ABSG97_09150 [Sedimentisphaerales bacterium]|jgi:hypothetical protein
MSVKRVAVHCVDIEDKPGSLQKFLTQSSLSGVDYLCFSAFSCGDNHGRVCVSAKDPKTFEDFAGEAGIKITEAAGFIIDGADRVGAAANVLKRLAEKDIRGITGAAIVCDNRYHLLVVVSAKDADRAQKSLGN